MAKYNTMHQHEPLPVPKSWDGPEILFANRLEEILDDLYRRFNRLKLTDLGGDINFADSEGNSLLTISEGGDVTAQNITTQTLNVGGQDLTAILQSFQQHQLIVSETQPDAHDVVWIKPVASSGQAGGEILESVTFTGSSYTGNGGGADVDISIPLALEKGSVSTALCQYSFNLRLLNTRNKRILNTVTVTLTGEDVNGDTQTITLLSDSPGKTYAINDYITVGTMSSPSGELTNVLRGNTATMAIHLNFSASGKVAVDGIVTAVGQSTVEDETGDAVKTCEVYYLS